RPRLSSRAQAIERRGRLWQEDHLGARDPFAGGLLGAFRARMAERASRQGVRVLAEAAHRTAAIGLPAAAAPVPDRLVDVGALNARGNPALERLDRADPA